MSDCRCIRGTGIGSAELYYDCKVACIEEKAKEKAKPKPKAEPKKKSAPPAKTPAGQKSEMERINEALERCAKLFGPTVCYR